MKVDQNLDRFGMTLAWWCGSILLNDKDNPNRYWYRPDAEALYDKSVGE